MRWIERWYVDSHSSDKEYTVSIAEDGETWGCSCPAWKFQRHRIRDGICKHIREVQNIIGSDHMVFSNTTPQRVKEYPGIRRADFFTEEEFAL